MKLEQIDTSTTAGKAEVMRLAAEGRRVAQALLISRKGIASLVERWEETSFPEWDWADYLYAIIAEAVGPDEMWVTFGQGGFVLATHAERPRVLAQDALNASATTVRYVRAD